MQVQGSGSRVLIVGAAGGIGGAATAALTAAGHEVVAADIRLDALPDEAAQKLYLDVTDDASIAAAVDAVEAAGPIDSLICCVGVSIWTPIEVADRTQLEDVFSLNVIGPMQLARAVLPAMRERGSGQIVMLSSGAGRMVTPLIGWYAATKHAIEVACEALRYDVGHLGVRVSVVEPGAFDTEIASRRIWARPEDPYYAQLTSDLIDALGRKNAKPGPVCEVADLLVRLVEDPAPRFRWPVPEGTAKAIRDRLETPDHEVEARMRAQMGLPTVPTPTP